MNSIEFRFFFVKKISIHWNIFASWKAIKVPNLMRSQLHSLVSLRKIKARTILIIRNWRIFLVKIIQNIQGWKFYFFWSNSKVSSFTLQLKNQDLILISTLSGLIWRNWDGHFCWRSLGKWSALLPQLLSSNFSMESCQRQLNFGKWQIHLNSSQKPKGGAKHWTWIIFWWIFDIK